MANYIKGPLVHHTQAQFLRNLKEPVGAPNI